MMCAMVAGIKVISALITLRRDEQFEDESEQSQMSGCRRCGGVKHWAHHHREPSHGRVGEGGASKKGCATELTFGV